MKADCRPATGYLHRPIIAVAENPASNNVDFLFRSTPIACLIILKLSVLSIIGCQLTFNYFGLTVIPKLSPFRCSVYRDCLYILRLLL